MKRASTWLSLIAMLTALPATDSRAADWPQWRGLDRAAKVTDFKAPSSWPKELAQKWTVTVGEGAATPSLVGNKLYVFARQDGSEILRCLDATTGQELWQDKYESQGAEGGARQHSGPRASPTVADGRVVTLGVRGVLSCVDAASGKVLWRKDEFKSWPVFFVSSSPIVVDGLVIAQLGSDRSGAIVAYDLTSGDEKWKWTGGSPAYASPVLMTLAGKKLLVALAMGKLVAVDTKNGELAWEQEVAGGGFGGRGRGGFGPGGRGPGGRGPGGPGPGGAGPGGERERGPAEGEGPAAGKDEQPAAKSALLERTGSSVLAQPAPQGERGRRGPDGGPGGRGAGGPGFGRRGGGGGGMTRFAATPVVDGDTIYYAGSGNALKAVKLEVQADKIVGKELWSNAESQLSFNTPILKDGLLFGLSSNTQFFCIDASTGKTAWTGPRDTGGGYGSIIDAGTVLLAITPGSELIVIKPTDKEYSELARIKVSDSPTYAHLVVSGNRLFVKDRDAVSLLTIE